MYDKFGGEEGVTIIPNQEEEIKVVIPDNHHPLYRVGD